MPGLRLLLTAELICAWAINTDFLGQEAESPNDPGSSSSGSRFFVGGVGDAGCPAGSAHAPKDLCLHAARGALKGSDSGQAQKLVEGEWDDLPAGCSVHRDDPRIVKFNRVTNQSRQKESVTPLCLKDGKYVAGLRGSGGPCPPGAADLNSQECTRASESVQSFAFSLIGRRGGEVVVISVDGNEYVETLASHWTTFMYPMPSNGVFTIFLQDDEGGGIDFQGMDPEMNVIKHLGRFPEWGCGQDAESPECIEVSSGRWAFSGTYEIRPVFRKNIVFRLLGRTGNEEVRITVGGFAETVQLGPEYHTFRYPWPVLGHYTIEFLNDNGPNDVYFVSEEPAMNIIRDTDVWSTWECGSESEDPRCDWVRSGDFAWAGHYLIKPVARHQAMLASNASSLPLGCLLQMVDGVSILRFNGGSPNLYSPVCINASSRA